MITVKLVDMCMIFHCTKFHLSKCNGSWAVSIKVTANFNFWLPPGLHLCFSQKWSYSNLFIFWRLSARKIPWSHVHWCRFSILRSLNIRSFRTDEPTRLKCMTWRIPSITKAPCRIYANILIGSKIVNWGTRRQEGDLTSRLLFPLELVRLQM
jgi:hypothetical protein